MTSLWPGFVQRVLDNKLSAFTSGPIHRTIVGLPELDKLIVRQTNWGLGMSYAAYTPHTVYQSIHLVYTVLSPCWFIKEKLSSTMQQMAHFMGHKTRRDGDCMCYHVRVNEWWDALTETVKYPLWTRLNPDELAPQWDILLPLCGKVLISQVSG